jgi:hypothetical protein
MTNLNVFQFLPTVALPSGYRPTYVQQATAFVGSKVRHVVNSTPEEEVEKIDKDMEEVNPQDFFPWGRCSR